MLDGGHDAQSRLQRLVTPLPPHLGHGGEHPSEPRPSIAVVAGEVGAAEVGPSIGGEKRGEGPAALATDGGNRGLVARVDLGPLVAIDLHRHVVAVDDLGHLRVLVGLAVHHMAPVAPDRADVKQDGLVLGLGAGKSSLTPGLPQHGLMARGTQVGRGRMLQLIGDAGRWGDVLVHGLRIHRPRPGRPVRGEPGPRACFAMGEARSSPVPSRWRRPGQALRARYPERTAPPLGPSG